MDSLASWLVSIGLQQYIPAFEANGIDLGSVSLLEDGELAAMGVLLGHRKLLSKAVAALESAHLESTTTVDPGLAIGRRQLTVVFCDVVGSTALAHLLDPEALRELMRAYQHTCRAIVDRYAGHVAQYLGDGIVVYFGFPQAHEDDAERAVRMAIDTIAAVRLLSGVSPFRVRVGIATGVVVVGESGFGDAAVPGAAVGQTPNLAARLQGVAGPDQIVVASSTRRLLGDVFDVEDLGKHDVKGIDTPVHAYRILDVARTRSRFDTNGPGRSATFVGREHEVALLLARWEQVNDGEGQVVMLVGEPGIGKSRITRVFRERLGEAKHLRLQYQCSPYHTGSAFYPIVESLEREAGFERGDSPEQKLDRLEKVLALAVEDLPKTVALFATLLSLPVDRYPQRMLSPQKQKELTIAAIVDQPIRLAEKQPVLMILEDAQWIDPSTLEVLTLLVESIRLSPILLVLTCRPENVPPLTGHGNVTTLNLNRLTRRQAESLVRGLTGSKLLPDTLTAQILNRADGVPLFISELVESLLEGGLLEALASHCEAGGPLPPFAIPSTLQDSLMARLDRLKGAKEVAQIGACIGREFSFELLQATGLVPDSDLSAALDKLVSSELVFRVGSVPDRTYSFKHALVRDVAYESLLRSRCKQIHQRIAHALKKDYPDLVKSQPETLALHLTRAGLIDEALMHWIAASLLARSNTRFREALGQVDAGLALIDRASSGVRADFEFALLIAGAACQFAMTGYASKPAADQLARAEALLDKVTDPNNVLLGLRAMLVRAYVAAEMPKAIAMSERCLGLAEETQEATQRIGAYASVAPVLFQNCELARTQRLLEFVVKEYDVHRRFTYSPAIDVKVLASSRLGLVRFAIGYPDQGRRYMRASVEHATAIADPYSISLALSEGSILLADAGDWNAAIEMSRRCTELCDTQRLPYWKSWALVGEGAALLGLGRYGLAEERLLEAARQLAASGTSVDIGYASAWRAIALAHLGRFAEARDEAGGCRQRCVESGQRLALPRLAHALGTVEMLDPDAPERAAEQWLSTALAESQSRGKRMIELRAATALARIWRHQGKRSEARKVLEPRYAWFDEGFDCVDLIAASVLLKELA